MAHIPFEKFFDPEYTKSKEFKKHIEKCKECREIFEMVKLLEISREVELYEPPEALLKEAKKMGEKKSKRVLSSFKNILKDVLIKRKIVIGAGIAFAFFLVMVSIFILKEQQQTLKVEHIVISDTLTLPSTPKTVKTKKVAKKPLISRKSYAKKKTIAFMEKKPAEESYSTGFAEVAPEEQVFKMAVPQTKTEVSKRKNYHFYFEIEGDIKKTDVLKKPLPHFKEFLEKEKIERVECSAEVNVKEDGSVSDVKLLKTTKITELDEEIKNKLYEWKFTPSSKITRKAIIKIIFEFQ